MYLDMAHRFLITVVFSARWGARLTLPIHHCAEQATPSFALDGFFRAK